MDLCAAGGVSRGVPPKEKLNIFLRNAITLNADVTSPILEDCLNHENWQVASKALATISELLKAEGCEAFFDYFEENPDKIEACQSSDKTAIRDRAVKVLHLLGLRSGNASSKPQKTSTRNPPTGELDLLGGFEDEPVVPPSPVSAPSHGSPHGGSSLLDEFSNPSPVSTTVDMFGGLQLGGAPTPTPQPNFDHFLEPSPPNTNHASTDFFMNSPMVGNSMGSSGPMSGPMSTMGLDRPLQIHKKGSVMMGSAMTPMGIAKTIQEPDSNGPTGFSFMTTTSSSNSSERSQRKDSFGFVEDYMKNS